MLTMSWSTPGPGALPSSDPAVSVCLGYILTWLLALIRRKVLQWILKGIILTYMIDTFNYLKRRRLSLQHRGMEYSGCKALKCSGWDAILHSKLGLCPATSLVLVQQTWRAWESHPLCSSSVFGIQSQTDLKLCLSLATGWQCVCMLSTRPFCFHNSLWTSD